MFLQYDVQKSIDSLELGAFLAVLKSVRHEAGLTQVELADRLGTIQSRITDYERGIRRIDLIELDQICKALGVELVEFVRRYKETLLKSDQKDDIEESF